MSALAASRRMAMADLFGFPRRSRILAMRACSVMPCSLRLISPFSPPSAARASSSASSSSAAAARVTAACKASIARIIVATSLLDASVSRILSFLTSTVTAATRLGAMASRSAPLGNLGSRAMGTEAPSTYTADGAAEKSTVCSPPPRMPSGGRTDESSLLRSEKGARSRQPAGSAVTSHTRCPPMRDATSAITRGVAMSLASHAEIFISPGSVVSSRRNAVSALVSGVPRCDVCRRAACTLILEPARRPSAAHSSALRMTPARSSTSPSETTSRFSAQPRCLSAQRAMHSNTPPMTVRCPRGGRTWVRRAPVVVSAISVVDPNVMITATVQAGTRASA